MAVVSLEVPMLLLLASLAGALVVFLLGTFTPYGRDHRFRMTFGWIAFALGGLMGFVSMLNAASALGAEWLAGKPSSYLMAIGWAGYLLFAFLGCWTAVRLAARLDRKHTLSVLYNLLKEHKERDSR